MSTFFGEIFGRLLIKLFGFSVECRAGFRLPVPSPCSIKGGINMPLMEPFKLFLGNKNQATINRL